MEKNRSSVEMPEISEKPVNSINEAGVNALMERGTAGDSVQAAQSTLDHMNLNDKLNLDPQQAATLRNLETSILKGDYSQLSKTLASFADNPDALTPVTDVLTKDLKAAGIRLNYEVNYPAIGKPDADGNPTGLRAGMFSLTTAETPEDFFTKPSTEICIYTQPDRSFAGYRTPVANMLPADQDISPGEAMRTIGRAVRENLKDS